MSAVKLISSIKSKPDLEHTNEQKLMDKCIAHGVALNQVEVLFVSEDAYLIPFYRF